MSKKKKSKSGIVVGLYPEQYKISDYRLNKPVCHQQYEKGILTGSMLLQEIDEVNLQGKKLTYFSPNNIGMLLSINSSYTKKAEEIFKNNFSSKENVYSFENTDKDKKEFLNSISSIVCDYIETVQIAIVFGYTALETFTNLSIPDGFTYKKKNKSKGIHELYEKDSIERWISLKEKIQYILTDIYKTKKAENQKWWGLFTNLEQLRNDIIHQKSVKHTEFYKCYFKQSIIKICSCPKDVIKFFYVAHEDQNQTNPIWPWLENGKNVFPVNENYNSNNFEVIGNIHEGIKKK